MRNLFSLLAPACAILATAAGALAQDDVVCYEFEDNSVSATTARVSATDLSIDNTFVFGGHNGSGSRWLCLTTDWNDIGGTISFTVTPDAGESIDLSEVCWTAVTNDPSRSDSITAISVFVDGLLAGTLDPVLHNTETCFDLSGIPELQNRTDAIDFQFVATGNPTGQTSYEIDSIKVRAAAPAPDFLCLENIDAIHRVVFLPIPELPSSSWAVQLGGGLTEFPDGTATLVAELVNVGDSEAQILLDVNLSGLVLPGETPPPGSPLLSDFVPGADPAGFRYYTEFSGTLTGREKLNGFTATLDRRAEALQIGIGANRVDDSFGIGAWYDVTVLTQAPLCPVTLSAGDIGGSLGDACIGLPAMFENYGSGVDGCGGTTTLTLSGRPVIGAQIDILVGNPGLVSANCVLLLSFGPADLFFAPLGGTFLVELPTIADLSMSVPSGGAAFPVFIQDDPIQVGRELYGQVIGLDTCAPNGVVFSAGLHLQIGDV